MRTYHPDPKINSEIIQQATEAETIDMAAGYPPRWWVCPKCESAHHRGHFGEIGNHRCLRCSYTGDEGTTHINDPRPYFDTTDKKTDPETGSPSAMYFWCPQCDWKEPVEKYVGMSITKMRASALDDHEIESPGCNGCYVIVAGLAH